jgi:membrane protein required for colicin V production
MTLVDLAILVVLMLAMFRGFSQGFFRSIFSLGGLVLGLVLASWNYGLIAALVLPMVHIEAVANVIGFLLIALIVMGAAGFAGNILSRIFHHLGLGFLDRLAGSLFGFFQGALLVTVVILATLAFYPKAHWLQEAQLPRYFFGACHLSTEMSPADLAERIRLALMALEKEMQPWLYPSNGGL